MLSFSLVVEALTGLIHHRPSGENPSILLEPHWRPLQGIPGSAALGMVASIALWGPVPSHRRFIPVSSLHSEGPLHECGGGQVPEASRPA